MLKSAADLKVKIFADGAEKAEMLRLYSNPLVKGFTTNPSLMKKAGVTDYAGFAHEIIKAIPDRHLSFEVFSDDLPEMERQARHIATWGKNVYVKIPVTNTQGIPTYDLVHRLSKDGINVNFTALFTIDQVQEGVKALGGYAPACISIFAGRISDTGTDHMPLMRQSMPLILKHKNLECIWASPRELLNLAQADEVGCQIITVSSAILNNLGLIGKDVGSLSLEAVRLFRQDSLAAGFSLNV